MKHLFSFALIFCLAHAPTLTPTSYGFSLKCSMEGALDLSELVQDGTMDTNKMLGVTSADYNALTVRKVLSCSSPKGNHYLITDFDIGPELYAMLGDQEIDYVISCPLISERRLRKLIKKNKKFGMVGFQLSAGVAVAGGKVGMMVNHRGALCFLAGGGSLAFGGGFAFNQFSIETNAN